MFGTRFEHVYIELVKVWNRYPDIKTEYLKTRCKEENIDMFIQHNFSNCFDEMLQVFERYYAFNLNILRKVDVELVDLSARILDYYGENFDVPKVENREFFSRYFGTFLNHDVEEF